MWPSLCVDGVDFVSVSAEDIVLTVAETMSDVLAASSFTVQDDFFLRGGDSLRAVELISRLTERFGSSADGQTAELGSALMVGVFDEATPASLASIIEQHNA
jgi:acyl carrier protein